MKRLLEWYACRHFLHNESRALTDRIAKSKARYTPNRTPRVYLDWVGWDVD